MVEDRRADSLSNEAQALLMTKTEVALPSKRMYKGTIKDRKKK